MVAGDSAAFKCGWNRLVPDPLERPRTESAGLRVRLPSQALAGQVGDAFGWASDAVMSPARL